MNTARLAALAARAESKRYRICPRCPYFCRVEEPQSHCPWCRVELRGRCACGHPVLDPTVLECAECGLRMRVDPQASDTSEFEPPDWLAGMIP